MGCFGSPFLLVRKRNMELHDIRGVGAKTEELFRKVGIETPSDLIRYYPVGYDMYTAPVPISTLALGAKSAVSGRVARDVVIRRYQKVTLITTEVSDASGSIRVSWYNATFVTGMLKRGSVWIFRGTVRESRGVRVMDHPEIIAPDKYAALQNTLVPVYSLTKGLSGKKIAKAVQEALNAGLPDCDEYLPASVRDTAGLTGEKEAIFGIHFPKTTEDYKESRRRLVFDEFFRFILSLRLLKERQGELRNAFPMKKVWECETLIDALPYTLTDAQKRVWREIEEDMSGQKLMSRLVQGDVGSGKTVIAFLSMTMALSNGYQAALMAPTEVLARQHYEKLTAIFEKAQLFPGRAALLTGSVRASERRRILDGLKDGSISVVIGTHALFQEGVSYNRLALVITDEQHRFGVRQRQALMEKGETPHLLIMSATPIPRTLGVIYYGDMDISVIDGRPGRRKAIKNAVVDSGWKEKAIHFIEKQLGEGRQAYVICPMIEASEGLEAANVHDEAAALRKSLPGRRISILHGQMKPEEKNDVMEKFLRGDADVLVSTTVVEVGVDVPNATVMLIENAERFGLAQLHQLRGRVGRGIHQSYCIFMAGQQSGTIAERLSILRDSDDGFEIAEKDFSLRGPGDLLGIRQSGDAMFRIADVTRDGELLKMASSAALTLCETDPGLRAPENGTLKRAITSYMEENNRNLIL